MDNLLNKIHGKKTYLICAAMLAYASLGYFLGKGLDMDLVWQALAVAGLRHAVPSKTETTV